jgi:hypothetical protein
MIYEALRQQHPTIPFEVTFSPGPPRSAALRFPASVSAANRTAVQTTLNSLTATWATEDAAAVADVQADATDRTERVTLIASVDADRASLAAGPGSLTTAQRFTRLEAALARTDQLLLVIIRMLARRGQ